MAGLNLLLASAAQDIEDNEDHDAVALLHELERGLADFDNGDRTEAELKRLFSARLTTTRTNHSQDAW